MKAIEKAILSSKNINGRDLYYLKIREYSRDGQCEEAELFCRVTRDVAERVKDMQDVAINILDSFYAVDRYFKGEEEFKKPVLVLKEIEIL